MAHQTKCARCGKMHRTHSMMPAYQKGTELRFYSPKEDGWKEVPVGLTCLQKLMEEDIAAGREPKQSK